MAGWRHRLDGHEFEQTPGVGGGRGGLACSGPWGHKESDRTQRLNNNSSLNSLCALFPILFTFTRRERTRAKEQIKEAGRLLTVYEKKRLGLSWRSSG